MSSELLISSPVLGIHFLSFDFRKQPCQCWKHQFCFNTEVKQHCNWIVLRWETTEYSRSPCHGFEYRCCLGKSGQCQSAPNGGCKAYLGQVEYLQRVQQYKNIAQLLFRIRPRLSTAPSPLKRDEASQACTSMYGSSQPVPLRATA